MDVCGPSPPPAWLPLPEWLAQAIPQALPCEPPPPRRPATDAASLMLRAIVPQPSGAVVLELAGWLELKLFRPQVEVILLRLEACFFH